MGKEETEDLLKFMRPFSEGNKTLALWLRSFVWDLYPKSNELIYDNYNALAFGWSVTDRLMHTFCSIALFGKEYIHFGFYYGSQIADPKKILEGKGSQYRYIKVSDKKSFPQAYIKKLLKEAYSNSLAKVKEGTVPLQGQTITKSISAKKRRPLK